MEFDGPFLRRVISLLRAQRRDITSPVLGLFIATFAVSALGVFWLSLDAEIKENVSSHTLSEETGIGTRDDPHARARYDWMRLRSPKTERIPVGIRKRELTFAKALPEQNQKAGSWLKRGPMNVGGRTRALAIDASNESVVLAGGVSGGIWRSPDRGTIWAKMTDPGQLHSVTWIEQDTRPGQTDTWYAGTGEFRGNTASGAQASFLGDGIYKSTDGGRSWQVLESTTSATPQSFDNLFDFVWKVRVDPSNTSQDEVYAATFGGIWRSTDGGNSWGGAAVLAGSAPFPDYTDVIVTSTGSVYASLSSDGATKGIWSSSDGTSGNWTNITAAGWPADYDRVVLAADPSDENVIWALARAPGNGPRGDGGNGVSIDHVLWKYDAPSGTWIDFSNYLPTRGDCDLDGDGNCDGGTSGATGDFDSQTNYNLTLRIHPKDSSILFVGGRNLWRIDIDASALDANTWIGGYTPANDSYDWYSPDGSDRHHPDQHVIAFLPSNGDVMYVGSDGGIHRTNNNRAGEPGSAGDASVSWTSVNDGYYTTQFYSVCFNPDASDPVIAGGMQDNGTWATTASAPGAAWRQESSGDGGFCAIANKSGGGGSNRYISSQDGKTHRIGYDSRGNRQDVTRIDPNGASGQLFINPFVLDPVSQEIMFYPAGSSMWRTANAEMATQSTGWTEMAGIGNNTSRPITALDLSKANDAHALYYGTSAGKVYKLDNADTAPPSATPIDVTNNLSIEDANANPPYVSSISINPRNANDVMVTFSNYEVESVFYTADGGSNWTNVEGNLSGPDGPSVRWGSILPQPGLDQTTYYLGTSIGVYSATSLNGEGTIWSQQGPSSIGDVVVEQVRAREADGLVLIGTHANGVYSKDEPIPVEFVTLRAVAQADGVVLTWKTATETNNAGFEIQHKIKDQATWVALDFVDGAGTTSQPQSYRYQVGMLNPGPHQFRLKQVDFNGAFEFSPTVEATVSLSEPFQLSAAYPNPSREQSHLDLIVRTGQHVDAALYNMLGQEVQRLYAGRIEANSPKQLLVESAELSSGIYMVRVTGETFSATRKLARMK